MIFVQPDPIEALVGMAREMSPACRALMIDFPPAHLVELKPTSLCRRHQHLKLAVISSYFEPDDDSPRGYLGITAVVQHGGHVHTTDKTAQAPPDDLVLLGQCGSFVTKIDVIEAVARVTEASPS